MFYTCTLDSIQWDLAKSEMLHASLNLSARVIKSSIYFCEKYSLIDFEIF